jgi:hypothetical protein
VKLPVSKRFIVLATVLAAPISVRLEHVAIAKSFKPADYAPAVQDPRTVRLHGFLSRLHCPIKDLAEEFIHAADDNNLDWRLLPSISIIESSGGKAYKNNNIMGWENGDRMFPTVRAGIHHVAFRLGNSFIYRDRSTDEKLHLYNPDEAYPTRVEDVMYKISPVVDLEAAAAKRLLSRSNLALFARN